MKLSGKAALSFCKAPDDALVGGLIHGTDGSQVMAARSALTAGLLGEQADDLRITRMEANDIRKDPAELGDALRAQGFFPGRRVVVVENVTDGLAKALEAALSESTVADAFLIATAGVLPAKSALRKLFEGQGKLISLHLFAEEVSGADINGLLAGLGLIQGLERDAAILLAETLRGMDDGSRKRLLETVALYGMDADAPMAASDLAGLIPADLSGDADELIAMVANGLPERVGPVLRRLSSAGLAPISVVLAMQRHFRQLLQAATAPGGASAGLAALRPPVWGARRDMMQAQLGRWKPAQLEQTCRLLLEIDGKLRSSQSGPEWALLERLALRLAIMSRR